MRFVVTFSEVASESPASFRVPTCHQHVDAAMDGAGAAIWGDQPR
jgi:hypothetical protein